MGKFNINTIIYWCACCGYRSQKGERSRTVDKPSDKLCPQCNMTLWEYDADVSREINYLQYNIENCGAALSMLKLTNEKLRAAMRLDSAESPLELGYSNRIIQDYLIIKVAGLFDKDSRTISFYNLLGSTDEIKKIEKEEIIQYLEEKRNRICAHSDRDYIKGEEEAFPSTYKILSSNLGEILKKLVMILNKTKNNLKNN